ncbi:MAG: serine protease [Verrucomicrobiota bacterium]
MFNLIKSGFVLLVMVGAFLSAGCVYHQSESVRAQSFAPHADRKLGGVEAEQFLRARVTLLVSSDPASQPRATNAAIRIFPHSNLGCAVAIDPRGYYLTAAHNLVHEEAYLFVASNRTISVMPARVVWRGIRRRGQPDLAILHVPTTLEYTFAWASEVQADEVALAVGLSWGEGKFSGFGLVGGKILNCRKSKSDVGELLVANDLPLQSGDSGGPLVDAEGRLIGINVQGTPPVVHWVLPRRVFPMLAERPQQSWLRETIEADVAGRSR